MTAQLQREGYFVNRKRVQRVMRENDLLAVFRWSARTTNSRHEYGRYPNLIRNLLITRPDQVWCADIKYIQLQRKFVYLADYTDYWDAYHRIGHFIEDVYPTKRIHSALDYLTPVEFEMAFWASRVSLAMPVLSEQIPP